VKTRDEIMKVGQGEPQVCAEDSELRMHPYLNIAFTSTHTVIDIGFGFAAALCLPAVCGRHS
jgi:hypothetical protein